VSFLGPALSAVGTGAAAAGSAIGSGIGQVAGGGGGALAQGLGSIFEGIGGGASALSKGNILQGLGSLTGNDGFDALGQAFDKFGEGEVLDGLSKLNESREELGQEAPPLDSNLLSQGLSSGKLKLNAASAAPAFNRVFDQAVKNRRLRNSQTLGGRFT
jgi:hypothetical protein